VGGAAAAAAASSIPFSAPSASSCLPLPLVPKFSREIL